MSVSDSSIAESGRDPTKRNVLLLFVAMALSNTGASLIMTVTALTGAILADKDQQYWLPFIGTFTEAHLPTLALSFQFIGTMLATIPAALLMRRIGRRAGFSIGQMIGFVGALLAAYAIYIHSFWLFVLSGGLIGMHNAFWAQYRFAAADTASPEFKPRAITYVMAGPVLAGIFGPQIAVYSEGLLDPIKFAGSYLAVAILAMLAVSVLQFIQIPKLTKEERADTGRPLRQILRREPGIWVAIFAAMVGYSSMSFLMTATPLAMHACSFDLPDTAFVIQWHIIAMFAPSFITGNLIQRFGVRTIIATGGCLFLTAVSINMTGVEIYQFWTSLVLVGIGWNFMYVGGTTMLTDCYRPAEKAKVQGFNDFMVFGMVAVASLMSGALQQGFGWQIVNMGIIAPVTLALILTALGGRARKPTPA